MVSGPRAPAPDDSEKEAARLYDDGVKEAKAGSWEKARVSMFAAFKLKPSYAWAANLGKVEIRAGKPRDAAEHLSFFLREAPTIEPDDRADVEKMLSDAKAQIGTATIRVNAPGAQVLVDEEPVGTAPLAGSVFVEPGTRWFEAKKDGIGRARQVVQITAGSTPLVELKLANGIVSMTDPDVQRHTSAPVESASPKWRSWTIAGGAGLAALGIGVGVGFAAAASAKNAAVIDESDGLVSRTKTGSPICPNQGGDDRCTNLTELAKARDGNRDVAIAGFAVGGVAAAGALIAFLYKPKYSLRGMQSRPRVVIVPSLQGALFVAGTF
jgi:hypothetical protein